MWPSTLYTWIPVPCYMLQTVTCANTLYSIASSSDQQINRSTTPYYRSQWYDTSISQDAHNAMTVHVECKESVEPHRDTLWNNQDHSVTNKACKVLRCTYGCSRPSCPKIAEQVCDCPCWGKTVNILLLTMWPLHEAILNKLRCGITYNNQSRCVVHFLL